ncbi:MAG: hypothetical protein MK291_11880 [Planctomycetes bacterium]|nr:hypothetical protein [Planctomycetota bacterium]
MDNVDIAASKSSLSPSQDTQRRVTAPSPRRVERPGAVDPNGEPVVELVSGAPSRSEPKVVGPGRKERAYMDKIHDLEHQASLNEQALENASLIERGSSNLMDRMERQLESSDEALERERAASRRVCVMLGSLQRENEVIREQLNAAHAQLAQLEAPKPKGLLRRLLGG